MAALKNSLLFVLLCALSSVAAHSQNSASTAAVGGTSTLGVTLTPAAFSSAR